MSRQDFACANAEIDKDWDELFRSFYTAWATPLQPVSQLTFAHLGANTPDERTAFQKAKTDLLEEARSYPSTVFWIKCVDLTTGNIVGGMCYKYERTWPNEATFAPTWFDEGSEMQRLSAGFYGELLRCRRKYMKGEHMYGEFAWVEPVSRHSIASQMIVDFGLTKVDEMGLEAYSEVNQFSAPMSLRSGFLVVGWTHMDFVWDKPCDTKSEDVPSKEVQTVERALKAHPIASVWRPIGGKYIEGETILPWTGRPRHCTRL